MKAQVWSTDFMASVVIFFTVVVVTMFAWNYIVNQSQEALSLNEVENLALSVADSLVRSQGMPPDWDENSVSVIGLAGEDGEVSKAKVEEFMLLEEGRVKRLLGISGLEYHFRLAYLNGSTIQLDSGDAEKGTLPPQNSALVIPVERAALYGGLPVKMELLIWR